MDNAEFPNIVTGLAHLLGGSPLGALLVTYENVVFSWLAAGLLAFLAWQASRCIALVPGRFQGAVEMVVGGFDDFVCGIIGPKGRAYTPFIGTLFLYILFMNLMGFIPFFRSATTSLSVTFALSLCVFCYVQYTAFKEMGVRRYADHLMGKPRGVIALSVILPFFMFVSHVIAELVRPVTLSLRLRSNIWGDDLMMTIFAGFGLQGLPMFFANMLISLVTSAIQAFVFAFLTTVYFSLALNHDPE